MKQSGQKRRVLLAGGLLLLLIIAAAWVAFAFRPSDGLIVRPGVYPSPSRTWNLNVSVTGNGIVNYTVIDAGTGQAVVSAGGFSTYHRWFFFWDEQNRLWTYNSDMGPFAMWSDDGTGSWRETPVATSSTPVTVPTQVHRALPRDVQAKFKPPTESR